MRAREIPKSYRNLTGNVISIRDGASRAFESGLEKDYLTLIDMDIFVARYQEQPVTIDYRSASGRKLTYTPDVLVVHRTDISVGPQETWLVEVKWREDIFKDWKKLKPKFKAARLFALKRGWRFKIITEKEIQTPQLFNAMFLKRYATLQSAPELEDKILGTALSMEDWTVNDLLNEITHDKWEKAKYIPYLWRLIFQRVIDTDLTEQLTMDTTIWAAR